MFKRQHLFQVATAASAMLAIVLVSRPASADIIPVFDSITGDAITGYTWTYNADVTENQRVDTGDYFTIYDFNEYIDGSATNPLGWTFTATPVGPVPPLVSVPDSPATYNLTWTWTGETQMGEMDLGMFSAKTVSNVIQPGYFAAYATRSTGPQAGTKISNVGNIETPAHLPEPGTLPLIGSVLLGGLSLMHHHRTRQNPGVR